MSLMVTPLRDGLNLVAKEYVAVKAESPGVLILSEFAGAASEMGEALLVNPYNVEQVADALDLAFNMSVAERCDRMKALYQRVHSYNHGRWLSEFFSAWKQAAQLRSKSASSLSEKNCPLSSREFKITGCYGLRWNTCSYCSQARNG